MTILTIRDTKYLVDDDSWFAVSNTFLEKFGFVGFILESMNDFYDKGLSKILGEVFDIQVEIENKRNSSPEDRKIEKGFRS